MVTFFRTIIMYIVVIIVMRIMGKRQIGQLQPYELVVALMVSELAAMPMQDSAIPLLHGIIPILTILAAQLLISFIILKSQKTREFFCGKPKLVIFKGKIIEDTLRSEMYNLNDLLEALRIKGYPNITEISCAILENNGQLSVLPQNAARPVTTSDMNIPVNSELPLSDLIVDGVILKESMTKRNITMNTLTNQIRGRGASSIDEVFYCGVDSKDLYYVQLKEK
jgi:uncharacterized membrane protein YcaP (DUF421 family)